MCKYRNKYPYIILSLKIFLWRKFHDRRWAHKGIMLALHEGDKAPAMGTLIKVVVFTLNFRKFRSRLKPA
jgi:hypothetical protein